jgi:AcrR family transcriptional regulator
VGLREQKRKKTEGRILSALDSLLARRVIEETAMSDIAALAKVSVGTLYNYFQSKDDLVFCFTRAKLQPFIARAQEISDNPPPNGQQALFSFLEAYLEGFAAIDRSVINRVMRVSMEQRALGGRHTRFHSVASNQLGSLVERLQAKGLVDSSTEPGAVALVLFSIFADLLCQYSDDATLDARGLHERLHKCFGLVFEGLRRRPPQEGSVRASGRRGSGHPQEVSP